MALISVKMDSYSSILRASTLLRLSEKDAAMQKYYCVKKTRLQQYTETANTTLTIIPANIATLSTVAVTLSPLFGKQLRIGKITFFVWSFSVQRGGLRLMIEE